MLIAEYSYEDDMKVQWNVGYEEGISKGISQGITQGLHKDYSRSLLSRRRKMKK